jgi:hypothetical protein
MRRVTAVLAAAMACFGSLGILYVLWGRDTEIPRALSAVVVAVTGALVFTLVHDGPRSLLGLIRRSR